MYARQVNHDEQPQVVTLAVSGKLWHRSLVMIDMETKSLWSHILGEAMAGPLEGTQLPLLPGLMTDFKTWRTRHPDSTVVTLSRTTGNYRKEFYRDPGNFVVGVAWGEEAKYWPFDELLKQPVINDTFRERPLVVVFDPESSTAFLYDRRLNGETLKFAAADDAFTDESGSKWNPATGKCVSGPHEEKVLKLIPGIVSYRHTWQAFHPE